MENTDSAETRPLHLKLCGQDGSAPVLTVLLTRSPGSDLPQDSASGRRKNNDKVNEFLADAGLLTPSSEQCGGLNGEPVLLLVLGRGSVSSP